MSQHLKQDERDRDRGQGLLEFALVVAFLLLVMFAIIDFSRLFFGYATMSNGVREGARYAIVHPTDDAGIRAAAQSMMVVIGSSADITIGFPDTDADGNPWCQTQFCRVVVTATSDFPVWTPVLPNVQIVTRATMYIE